ncbi:MAG TPA: hypothetical protein VIW69_00515 [Candidatus Elarobacter sp.]
MRASAATSRAAAPVPSASASAGLIAWANADAPRRVVIAGDPDGPVALHRRLGFVPASHLDAVIVPVVPCSTGAV